MVSVTEPIPSIETQRRRVPQLARRAAEEFVSPTGSESSEPNYDCNSLFDLALSFQEKKDYEMAIAYYTRAIELSSQTAEAYVNRGAAYESMGNLDLALQDFNTALALEPKSEAYNNRANVYFRKRDYQRAIQDYSKALELERGNVGAFIYRGHAFKNMELYDHAIQDYSEALVLDPGNADAYTSIGSIHSLRGDHNNAIRSYDQALKLDSCDPYTYLSRGTALNAKGDLDSAEKDFGKTLKLDPESAYAYVARGLVFIKKGEFGRALQDLNQALQLNPEYAFAQAVRGSLYLENGDLDRAIQDLDKSLALDPENINAYNDRGVAYERKGYSQRAMQDYDHALGIRPNQVAYANRGIALLRQSQWDNARSDLLCARNMGMDLMSVIHAGYGSVADFEETHDLKLPQDIVDMLSLEETPQPTLTGESILDMFERLRKSVPPDTWDELPTDLVKNKKHYLYGHPKETE